MIRMNLNFWAGLFCLATAGFAAGGQFYGWWRRASVLALVAAINLVMAYRNAPVTP